MYFLLEFKDNALYEIIDQDESKDKLLAQLTDTRVVSSEDFLESHCMLIRKKDSTLFYYKWTIADAYSGKRAYRDLMSDYHFIKMVDGQFDVCAKLKAVTPTYFYFRSASSLELYMTNFVQGDPFDTDISDSI